MPLRVAVCLHLQAPASLCGCTNNAVEFVDQNFPLIVCHLVASQKTPAGPVVGNGDQPASVISATHCTLSMCCLRGLCLAKQHFTEPNLQFTVVGGNCQPLQKQPRNRPAAGIW
jgi:hypothetical protein